MNTEEKLILLGFSSSVLAMIFNALKEESFTGEILVLQNMPVEDIAPYDAGMKHRRMFHTEYKIDGADRLFLSVANTTAKMKLFEAFTGYAQIEKKQFANVIHPQSCVSDSAMLKNGIYIGPGSVIEAYSQIGFGVFINRSASVGHHTFIGEFSTINPGVHIAGNCNIGKSVSIGIGTVVFDNLTIGAGSIIGGGSVVTRDIPAGVLAFGNPCKVIRELT